MVQLSHPFMTTGKTISLTIHNLVSKVMSLLFNMLSWFVIAFLPRSKLNFMAEVTVLTDFVAQIKSVSVSTFSPSICHEVMGPDAMILVFRMLSFKPAFYTLLKMFFSSTSLSAIRAVSSAYLRLLIFLPTILISACYSSSLHDVLCI